jgi:hypothetical protein
MKDSDRLDRLEAQVRNMEGQITFLLKINGLDVSKLRNSTDEELLSLYQSAVQLLGLPYRELEVEIVLQWSEIFLQLSEYEMLRLKGIVDYTHTWEPFYQLCIRMLTAIRQHPRLPEEAKMQQLYAVLERSRSNLRDSAVIMCQKFPDTISKRSKLLLQDDSIAFALPR